MMTTILEAARFDPWPRQMTAELKSGMRREHLKIGNMTTKTQQQPSDMFAHEYRVGYIKFR